MSTCSFGEDEIVEICPVSIQISVYLVIIYAAASFEIAIICST